MKLIRDATGAFPKDRHVMAEVALALLAQVVVIEDPYLDRWVPGISAHGRLSFLSGTLSDGDVYYSDNFDEGYGLDVEIELLRGLAPGYQVGGYLSVSWDHFDGDEFSDAFGTSVDPEALDMTTWIGGLKSLIAAAPDLLIEGRIGGGVARYEAVDADVVDLGTPLGTIEFFESSSTPVFELGGRFSYGPPAVSFGLGLFFRIQGGPEEADASAFLIDPDSLWIFGIDAGLSVRF
jgi:hypothetical protein